MKYDELFHGSVSIFTSRRRVEIQTVSEIFHKCVVSGLLHTLLAQLNAIQTLLSSISTISMIVVKSNTYMLCSVKYKV